MCINIFQISCLISLLYSFNKSRKQRPGEAKREAESETLPSESPLCWPAAHFTIVTEFWTGMWMVSSLIVCVTGQELSVMNGPASSSDGYVVQYIWIQYRLPLWHADRLLSSSFPYRLILATVLCVWPLMGRYNMSALSAEAACFTVLPM